MRSLVPGQITVLSEASSRRARNERAGDLCSPAGGFTLIELLVVVSIICLMMSVMLPSLTRAHKQGEQIHCLANQHQLILAWMQYSTDHDDLLCRPEGYRSALERYVPLEGVFLCKTVGQETTRRRFHRDSYGVSNTMGGDFRDGVQPYRRFHRISQPSEWMVFVDKELDSSTCFWPLLRDSDRKRWLWRPPNLFGVGGITSRHSNGCNMTFADGHGEMIRWKDERTLRLIKGTIADEVEASDGNADLEYLVRILVGNRPVQDQSVE
jgi:prepilin-type processing-associated H-X9-DG protein/prepilin-type N-terminal cleavage/methylation domain-containing protein